MRLEPDDRKKKPRKPPGERDAARATPRGKQNTGGLVTPRMRRAASAVGVDFRRPAELTLEAP